MKVSSEAKSISLELLREENHQPLTLCLLNKNPVLVSKLVILDSMSNSTI
uniref:Uncharacterized protein n=1 Tax=Cucumis melo TaxID=3656 RepID=A0A9I9E0P5_CUCME